MNEKLKNIRALIMDADGVLTDGRIILGSHFEISVFDAHDGFGITLAKRANLITAIVSGRESETVFQRIR